MGLILISSSIARLWPEATAQNLKTLQLGLIAPACGVVGFFWGGLFFDHVRPETQQRIVRWLAVMMGSFVSGPCSNLSPRMITPSPGSARCLRIVRGIAPSAQIVFACCVASSDHRKPRDGFRPCCCLWSGFSPLCHPSSTFDRGTGRPRCLRRLCLPFAGRRKMQLMMILAAMILSACCDIPDTGPKPGRVLESCCCPSVWDV